MKYFLSLLAVCFMVSKVVEAKYKYPEGATTTTERRINRRMNRYDTDKDGEITLEDYKNYRQPRTRDERRMERRAKNHGTYVSPEDAFKAMDEDGDGRVTKEEMLKYERAHQN